MSPRKYLLKPGKHQFAPGEHARHDNDSITDAEAEWYLKRYPHIKSLFRNYPVAGEEDTATINQPQQGIIIHKKKQARNRKPEIRNQVYEDLSATN